MVIPSVVLWAQLAGRAGYARTLAGAYGLQAVGIAFVSLGLFFGTWAVMAADIEDALDLGHGGFGALLAVALVGTVTTSMFTGGWVERFGTGVVLGWGAVAFAIAAASVGLGGGTPLTLAIATVAV